MSEKPRHLHAQQVDAHNGKAVYASTCGLSFCISGAFFAQWVDHISYVVTGEEIPISVWAMASVAHPRQVNLQRVEKVCLPPFGIPERLRLFAENVTGCDSAACQQTDLVYGGGVWTGAISLASGTLTLTCRCIDGELHCVLGGCGNNQTVIFTPNCLHPFFTNIQQITLQSCCTCNFGGGTLTIGLFGYLPPIYKAQWVDYHVKKGRAVYAYLECPAVGTCVYSNCCDRLPCNLFASFSAGASGCACLNGVVIPLSAGTGMAFLPGCGAAVSVTVICENLPDDGTGRHCARFTASVVCGADCTAVSATFQLACDQDCNDLDISFPMSMSCATPPGACCVGAFVLRITR
jgi:hypothetical protein